MYNYIADKTVLVVDDVPMVCSFLKSIMHSLGAKQGNVDFCYTAEEAMHRISKKFYDIILCDYYLGEGKNGQHILEEGRTCGYIGASTIFLMITAEKTRAKVVSVIEHEPDAYVVKPFNKTILKDYLEKTIAKKREIEEINRAIVEKNTDYAIQLCDKKIREAPQNSLEYFRVKSNILMDAQRYTEAQKIFDTFIAKGELLWAKTGNAKISYFNKDYSKAKALFEEIIENPNAQLECYDMLADSLVELGNPAEAQRVLELAVRLSPNLIQRRRALAKLALGNGDIELASRNFKALISLSKDSIDKNHADYLGFARILINQKKYGEALSILRSAKHRFNLDSKSQLEVAILGAKAFFHDRNKSAASANLKEAKKHLANLRGEVDEDFLLASIELGLLLGDVEYSRELAESAMDRFLQNQASLGGLRETFKNANQEQVYNDIVMLATNDIAAINRRGVQLFEQGHYKEAIAMFERATDEQPADVVMALNAAQALIVFMQKNGVAGDMKARARSHLEKVDKGQSDANDNRYEKLLAMLKKL